MKKEYTFYELMQELSINAIDLCNYIRMYDIESFRNKLGKKVYSLSTFLFLNSILNPKIEIVEVPVNVPVYYEILQSKINVL